SPRFSAISVYAEGLLEKGVIVHCPPHASAISGEVLSILMCVGERWFSQSIGHGAKERVPTREQ
ncbi:hypothetical protein BaRGS_00008997, partial [Batillaria attramentaria]